MNLKGEFDFISILGIGKLIWYRNCRHFLELKFWGSRNIERMNNESFKKREMVGKKEKNLIFNSCLFYLLHLIMI